MSNILVLWKVLGVVVVVGLVGLVKVNGVLGVLARWVGVGKSAVMVVVIVLVRSCYRYL